MSSTAKVMRPTTDAAIIGRLIYCASQVTTETLFVGFPAGRFCLCTLSASLGGGEGFEAVAP